MRLLLCAQLMLLALTAYATGQDGDVIYINGERLELLGKPICLDSTLYHTLKDELPSNRHNVTSNWDGFTAYWSIINDKLYLDSVRCEAYDPKAKAVTGESIPSMTLYRIFNKYSAGNRIAASWVSGKIRVAKGKVIYYQHTGYERNYEEETLRKIYSQSCACHVCDHILENKVKSLGGQVVKVDTKNAASQYDFTDNSFEKHELNERNVTLSNGDTHQRDMLAAFNLQHLKYDAKESKQYDVDAMNKDYNRFCQLEEDEIMRYKNKEKKDDRSTIGAGKL